MKAKRFITTLTVAAFALSATVSLDSCHHKPGPGPDPVPTPEEEEKDDDLTMDEFPSTLAGRIVTAQHGNAAEVTFTFIDANHVKLDLRLNGDDARNYTGTYTWYPKGKIWTSDLALERLEVDGTYNLPGQIQFSVNTGVLSIVGIMLKFSDGLRYFTSDECHIR